MAFNNSYVFGFATVICVVCSVSVATVSVGLKDRQDDNKRRDRQASILGALGLPEDGHVLAGEEVDELWKNRVELRFVDPGGEQVDSLEFDQDGDGQLTGTDADLAWKAVKGTDQPPSLGSIYVRMDGEQVGAYAIPMRGAGLWGPISGFLALDPGVVEITGATFFAPKETPGLGAEIQEPKFERQFVGKRVSDDAGAAKPVRVVKGAASNLCPQDLDYCVDGVSGATITSRGVDVMVAEAVDFYDPYLKRVRGR